MTVMPLRKRTRAVGFMVTATLPLCLAACASPVGSAMQQSMELSAGADSDLLDASTERYYSVTELRVTAASLQEFSARVDAATSTSGHIVLLDGMITEADLSVRAVDGREASFELTEPVPLRPMPAGDGSQSATTSGAAPYSDAADAAVNLVGTLTTENLVRRDTRIRAVPTAVNDELIEFDVNMRVPDHPMLSSSPIPAGDEITAHIVFTAE